MLTENDLNTLKQRGLSPQDVEKQIKRFQTGFPILKLAASATPGNGIEVLSEQMQRQAVQRWQKYLADGGSVCKFVPASGAASRMFKALYAFVNGSEDVPSAGSDVDEVIKHIDMMPFANELDEVLTRTYGKDAQSLIAQGRYKDVISAIVNPEGLNYGNLPKGLLSFHRYADGTVHTPVQEQLTEGAQTAATNGNVDIHFTVSENHVPLFRKKVDETVPALEKKTGLKFNVTLSTQSPATDTVAANPDNTLFRDDNGNMVFRPGGHGALITNLSQIPANVVFIKNIDNVVPDNKRSDTIHYKQVLAGVLILAHDFIAAAIKDLDNGDVSPERLAEMKTFATDTLCIHIPDVDTLGNDALRELLRRKFDRPLRVCGMVRNQGEPGGGPYIAFNPDGTASPQILESSQIDTSNTEYARMMGNATHFNPVDLVCYIANPEGKHYNLADFVDPDTGFISSKSLDGRNLKALELPGLWNGAMSDWNTIFVEVPVSTFNPVKTVNDLLRPVHQA